MKRAVCRIPVSGFTLNLENKSNWRCKTSKREIGNFTFFGSKLPFRGCPKDSFGGDKKRGWVETLPRYKIQYPMKNHGKDATKWAERCTITEIYFQQ